MGTYNLFIYVIMLAVLASCGSEESKLPDDNSQTLDSGNDGVSDNQDAFPNDSNQPNETVDTEIPASADEWEVQIVASTPDGAENSLYFGQKPDATDGYDSRYEVRAMLGGDIKAYFPRAEWDVLAKHFWRDIKAPDPMKSWVFEVNTAISGTETMLKWNPLKLPDGYAVELTDMAQNTVIDMTSQSEHNYYTYSGPRQFTINTKAPD
jgi:hypothetical protein